MRIGEILNVSVIVIGDVNFVFGQYNVDVRAVNVQTGEIVAKEGIEIPKGASYRDKMRSLAERLSPKIPVIYLNPKLKPEPRSIDYRPTGGSVRFLGGGADIVFSIAYNNQIIPSFLLGCGAGFGFGLVDEYSDWRGFYFTNTDWWQL